jgi:hypothetical protein
MKPPPAKSPLVAGGTDQRTVQVFSVVDLPPVIREPPSDFISMLKYSKKDGRPITAPIIAELYPYVNEPKVTIRTIKKL